MGQNHSNAELERCVRQRTRELTASNRALRNEVTQRRRVEQELNQRVRLAVLDQEIAGVLTRDLGLPETLQPCAESLARHLELALVQIWVTDDSGKFLQLHGHGGPAVAVANVRKRVRIGETGLGKIAATQREFFSKRAAEDAEFAEEEWLRRENIGWLAILPLIVEGLFFGVLACYARREPDAVIQSELRVKAETIALSVKRSKAEFALHQSREQFRALAARLESLREEERIRLSREIHDEAGQELTALKMDLVWIERRLGEIELIPAMAPILDRVVAAAELADQVTNSIHKVAASLRPDVLDKLGLAAALESEARRFRDHSQIVCQLDLPEHEPELPEEIATALFRIFQECLTNVLRHARATEVRTQLRVEDNAVTLRVADNGIGLVNTELTPPRLGIIGMQERAAQLGGEVQVQRGAIGGTVVIARIPLPPQTRGRP